MHEGELALSGRRFPPWKSGSMQQMVESSPHCYCCFLISWRNQDKSEVSSSSPQELPFISVKAVSNCHTKHNVVALLPKENLTVQAGRQTDERMDRWVDGWADGWTDRQTDRLTYRHLLGIDQKSTNDFYLQLSEDWS